MDRITSEYVITVHFHMKYTKIESFLCHIGPVQIVCVSCLSFFLSIAVLSGKGFVGKIDVMLLIYFSHGTKC